jgi:ribosomal protein L28
MNKENAGTGGTGGTVKTGFSCSKKNNLTTRQFSLDLFGVT